MKNFKERVIIALDYSDLSSIRRLVERLKGEACFYKIGSEAFTSCGINGIDLIKDCGGKIFLDLKFHDIPNTVYRAVKSAGKLGVDIINVHASGGVNMMRAAKRGAEEASYITGKNIDVIAVTVLTNLSDADINRIFYNLEDENNASGGLGGNIVSDLALHLAKSAKVSGLDGVVCSGHESLRIKNILGSGFKTITPGIRLKSDNDKNINAGKTTPMDDQKRVMTPSAAFDSGADYIVVGREITATANPADALRNIYYDIENNCK